MFPDQKKKAVTFSYDDGTEQDIRLAELFHRYGLKATFNINSGLFGQRRYLDREGKRVEHNRLPQSEIRAVYQGHEVAAHTLDHCRLPDWPDAEVIRQVEEDRRNLEELMGYEIVGMAYSCGGVNHDARTARLVQTQTGVRYARTITSSHSFEPQEDLYQFRPTVHHHSEWEMLFKLADDFVSLRSETPQIFYIWGHSFEFDIDDTWDRFEEFCRRISGHDDIFYGTNREVLLPGE